MLSTRYLALLALAAAATALPASDDPVREAVTSISDDDFSPAGAPGPWFNVPFFGDITKLFAPLWKLFPSFEDLGPRIIADDDKFQVIVQVKEYKKKDLEVKSKGDFIFVKGTQETSQQDHDVFASQFYHTYTLPNNASAAGLTAQLTSDGYLIVTAPMTGSVTKSKDSDRVVPIEETGTPYKKEEVPEISPIEPDVITSEPELSTEDDRKEPTTPPSDLSVPEDVTEKDNVIPHGNEVSP